VWGKTAKGNPGDRDEPGGDARHPAHDDGLAVGSTPRRSSGGDIIALVTALFLLIGWIWQASAFPVKIPQQVVQFEPRDRPRQPPGCRRSEWTPLGEVDYQSEVFGWVDAKNVSNAPIELSQFAPSLRHAHGFVNAHCRPAARYRASTRAYALDSSVGDPSIPAGRTTSESSSAPGERCRTKTHSSVGEPQLTISGSWCSRTRPGRSTRAEMEEAAAARTFP